MLLTLSLPSTLLTLCPVPVLPQHHLTMSWASSSLKGGLLLLFPQSFPSKHYHLYSSFTLHSYLLRFPSFLKQKTCPTLSTPLSPSLHPSSTVSSPESIYPIAHPHTSPRPVTAPVPVPQPAFKPIQSPNTPHIPKITSVTSETTTFQPMHWMVFRESLQRGDRIASWLNPKPLFNAFWTFVVQITTLFPL